MASAETYEPIATYYSSSGTDTQIIFSSIPQTYTDLVVHCFHGNNFGPYYWLYFQVGNGSADTGSNYSATMYNANNSSYAGGRYNATDNMKMGGSSNGGKTTNIGYIFDYANTTTWKSSLSSFGFAQSSPTTQSWVGDIVNTWKNTAAINYIKVTNEGGQAFAGDTIITLYGLKKA